MLTLIGEGGKIMLSKIFFGGTKMKKTIIAIVAVIALVAILGTVLVACNQEDYQKRLEKKGYKVGSLTDGLGAFGLSSNTYEWTLSGTKGNDYVSIVKYRNADDAKKAYEDAKEDLKDDKDGKYAVKKVGKIVIAGTKQGVRDAG